MKIFGLKLPTFWNPDRVSSRALYSASKCLCYLVGQFWALRAAVMIFDQEWLFAWPHDSLTYLPTFSYWVINYRVQKSLFFQISILFNFGSFCPKRIWSLDIWSPTIGLQLIGPSGQTVTNQFSPHGQMVPNQFGPPGQMVLKYSVCPGAQAVGIQKYRNMGTKFLGIICLWGLNLMGTVCPGGSI